MRKANSCFHHPGSDIINCTFSSCGQYQMLYGKMPEEYFSFILLIQSMYFPSRYMFSQDMCAHPVLLLLLRESLGLTGITCWWAEASQQCLFLVPNLSRSIPLLSTLFWSFQHPSASLNTRPLLAFPSAAWSRLWMSSFRLLHSFCWDLLLSPTCPICSSCLFCIRCPLLILLFLSVCPYLKMC